MISSEKRKLFQKSQSSKFVIFQNFPVFVFYFKKNYFTIKRPQERKQTFYRFNPSKCFGLCSSRYPLLLQFLGELFQIIGFRILILSNLILYMLLKTGLQTDDLFIILVIHLFETLNTSLARS